MLLLLDVDAHSNPIILFITVDGAWAVWSAWDQCSTSCGKGTVTRTRSCSDPPPQKGGKSCSGINTETKTCTLRACPGIICNIILFNCQPADDAKPCDVLIRQINIIYS